MSFQTKKESHLRIYVYPREKTQEMPWLQQERQLVHGRKKRLLIEVRSSIALPRCWKVERSNLWLN